MISFKDGIFHIKTNKTSYIIGLLSGRLLHLYWGKGLANTPSLENMLSRTNIGHLSATDIKIESDNLKTLGREAQGCNNETNLSTDNLTMEYSTFGSVDLRTPSFHAEYKDGSTVTNLIYDSYEIINGKPKLNGLPATYSESGDDTQTLKIKLTDKLTGVNVFLLYGVFSSLDAITRSVIVENTGNDSVKLCSVLSASVDFNNCDYDFIHLYGSWARERKPQRVPVFNGSQHIDSLKGASSAHHNPFFALTAKNTDERQGDAYGFSLVYSGNFTAGVDTDTYNVSRAYIGINPFGFKWILNPGDSFTSPEAVLVYSPDGIGGMSRIYHRLFRTRLVRGKYRDTERPVLINNWEATMFDFDEEKIVKIAGKAKECGIELMVLDDGWFGKRNSDNCSLGDWTVNKEKLPGGISGLSNKISGMGMKFGLWFEPEMISPDSNLYREHPDWCLHVKNRERHEERNQLTLDLSRSDVCDYIKAFLDETLSGADISYVKWDMNRNMSEVGSELLAAEQQGEVYHRYILGLYSILEYITTKYPDILFEACASGGGRYDAGMLYYMPQIWASDDSDALERLYIQYGTSLCYPYSSMGAHVSEVPNQQVSRTTPFKMRGDTAICGQLGYELDLNKLSEKELCEVKAQLKQYKELGEVFHKGDLYRLNTPDKGDFVANEFISEDQKTVVLCSYTLKGTPNDCIYRIYFQNLDETAVYTDQNGNCYYGDELCKIGLRYQCEKDYVSELTVFKKSI